MKLKKTTLSIALATLLSTGTAQALHYTPEIVNMDFNGLFVLLDPTGAALQNVSYPYYGDPTWGYGFRTQISGTFSINQFTREGSATINQFEFFTGGPAFISDFEFKATDNGLLIGNMVFNWKGNNTPTQIVLDVSGLFAELSLDTQVGDTYDAASCTTSGACATPASNGMEKGNYPIGPTPIATSSFNTAGQTGQGTTLSQLSLGVDDNIGGSPQDNGPTSGFNVNFDITSLVVTSTYSTVPVPAAVWLFGSGLLGLAGVARRRRS